MSALVFSALNLSQEEAEALIEVSEGRYKDLVALIGQYSADEQDRTINKLKELRVKQEITGIEGVELAVVQLMHGATPSSFRALAFNAKLADGYFKAHESFGCVSRTDQTSSHPSFVGTPTLESNGISMKFSRAEFASDEFYKKEPVLDERRRLIEVVLSRGQFAGLIRDKRASSPCKLSMVFGESLDTPPRMVSSVSIAKEARAEASVIGAPLMTACANLQAFLDSSPKISTKAQYAELVSLAGSIQFAIEGIIEPMRSLLKRTAGLLADSSAKQLMVDIAEPLKALGMDSTELYQRLTGPV
jgi:hypothetical protein